MEKNQVIMVITLKRSCLMRCLHWFKYNTAVKLFGNRPLMKIYVNGELDKTISINSLVNN